MSTISIREAKNKLTELARRVEQGESFVVTRNGKPVLELVPPKRKGGIDFEAGERWLKARGITRLESWISPDFDDPLPEDFLSTPITYPGEK
ncbi:MAG: type II toxin-antitoxin system Phd/YefM family antitoxin [Beijerinckiaceae bacterium]